MKEYKIKELKKVVIESRTLREVLLKFDRNDSAASYRVLNKLLNEWNIDFSHFLNKSQMTKEMFSQGALIKKKNEEIFCKNSSVARNTVKKRLIDEEKIKYVCNKCNQDEMWNGEKMSLILDHINGVRNDNRIENLRFLCPNCNSTLPTHCRGSEGLVKKENIDKRKIKKDYASRPNNRKITNRPDRKELEDMLKTMSYCAVGRKYGISDNAVRKWAKTYGII